MVACAIFGCKSNNNKRLKINQSENCEKIKFFKFPSDKTIEKIWINKCGRKDKINVKYAAVCSKHFSAESYYRNLQHELLNYSPKSSKKLKKDAIPTENLPFPEKHSKGREERQKKRDSKKVIRELLETYTISKDVVPDIPKSPEPPIVPTPLRIDKSTNTEDNYERLLKTQADHEELLIQHKSVLAENYILKTENDA